MSRLLAAQRALTVPGWVKDELWRRARATPSLDLRFADSKSLVDATTGQNLVTFSRASGGTYVDSQGVIRNATTNLLLRSEEFDNASWAKTGLLAFGSGSIANTTDTTAPNGTFTADKIIEDTSNGAHQLQQGTPVSGTAYSFSVYAKQAGRSRFTITGGGFTGQGFTVVFNLSTGSLDQNSGSKGFISSVGNGWYRCTISFTTSNTVPFSVALVNDSLLANYTGDGTSGIYLWGAQLEQSSTVGEYIPTGATINSAPRFDHNPTTGESLGLLVEESRQNLLLRSGEFDNASWTKTGLLAFGSGSVADSTGTLAPDGTNTADLLVEDTSTGAHQVQQGVPASGTAYSYSIYAKAAGRTKLTITGGGFTAQGFTVVFNLVTGTLDQNTGEKGSITSCGNGWYRCVISFTTSSTAPFSVVFVNDSQLTGYTGDGTSGIYLWGAQLEAGAFPTSYIPTTTAAATRSADVASITDGVGSGSILSSGGGNTLFAQFRSPASGTRPIVSLDDNSANERIELFTSGTDPKLLVTDGGVAQADIDAGTIAANTSTRLAARFAANDFAASVGGNTSVIDTSGTMPTVDRVRIGANQAGGYLNGHIARVTNWPTALPMLPPLSS